MDPVHLYDSDGVKYATLICGQVVWFVSPQKFKLEQDILMAKKIASDFYQESMSVWDTFKGLTQ